MRDSCKHWRLCVSQTVTKLRLLGLFEKGLLPEHQAVDRFLSQFPHLEEVAGLPFRDLPCLRARLQSQLTSLTLEGTGTDVLYSVVLPRFCQLQRITFLGPITMTDELIVALGNLPELLQLTFHKILFPRVSYQASILSRSRFARLQSLKVLHVRPLSSNGLVSVQAGQQFLLSLQALCNFNVRPDSASTQMLLLTLDGLPVLKCVSLHVHFMEYQAGCMHDLQQWYSWAQGSGVQIKLVGETQV